VHIGKTRADAIYLIQTPSRTSATPQVGGQKERCKVWLLGNMGDAAALGGS